MTEALRQQVRERAGRRCEYCHLPDWLPPLEPFHLEHIVARQHGGETNLDNLLLLCSRHHRYVHEQGYTIRIDAAGTARFKNRYGVAIPNAPPRPPPSGPHALSDQHPGLAIDANTTRNGLRDPMDLALTVDAIIAAAG